MGNLKLVLLDYPKKHLENPNVQRIMNDLLVIRQQNYERTDPNYIVIDKHDLIATHILIYETSNIFNPQLIFAIRVVFESRAQQHKLKTPLQDLRPILNSEFQEAIDKYLLKHKSLVESGSLFVTTQYSHKNSGLQLSDIAFSLINFHLQRLGLSQLVGCTNEKYKAHRLLENIGSFQKNLIFNHPVVPNPHMLIMIEEFNKKYIESVYKQNKNMFDELIEILPADIEYEPMQKTIQKIFSDKTAELIEMDFSKGSKKAG